MDQKLFTLIAALGEVKSLDELQGVFERAIESFGFEYGSAVAVEGGHGGLEDFKPSGLVLPSGYREECFDVLAVEDPVMQHMKRSSLPIVWGVENYDHDPGLRATYEVMSSFGMKNGVCLALHLPDERHQILGFERAEPIKTDPSYRTMLMAGVQLFATHYYEAYRRIASANTTVALPKLTKREIDVLQWSLVGKTAWEVGQILSISESTVAKHAMSAAQKLGANGKAAASAMALKLGLIRI